LVFKNHKNRFARFSEQLELKYRSRAQETKCSLLRNKV
jgi:hypothetical protein